MNSMEEDQLFEYYGWFKNLIRRQWEAPVGGYALPFDELVQLGSFRGGEEVLRQLAARYGRRQ